VCVCVCVCVYASFRENATAVGIPESDELPRIHHKAPVDSTHSSDFTLTSTPNITQQVYMWVYRLIRGFLSNVNLTM
jgi:hypothetical protein